MELWVDSIVKVSNIPVIYNQGNIFFENFRSMINTTGLIIMLIVSKTAIIFFSISQ